VGFIIESFRCSGTIPDEIDLLQMCAVNNIHTNKFRFLKTYTGSISYNLFFMSFPGILLHDEILESIMKIIFQQVVNLQKKFIKLTTQL